MNMRVAFLAMALAFSPSARAAYTNLIASSDGRTLYFDPQAGLYRANWDASRTPNLRPVDLQDSTASGAVTAAASFGFRYCGFAGSSCFLRPGCQASFTVSGDGLEVTRQGRQTFIRLEREGRLAWIEQDPIGCGGLGIALVAPLNGLYQLPSLTPVAPAGSAVLANRRVGRRAITSTGRALTFAGPQLQWLDANGASQIRHVYGAYEAVTDASGTNIVYVDAPVGGLHWISAGNDEVLNVTGSAPAVTDDGTGVVFLSESGNLEIYTRATRSLRQLGSGRFLAFTVGGGWAFAVTSENRLVRLELAGGAATTLAEPFPEITSINAPPLPVAVSCPLVCYGTPQSWFVLGRGMVLVLHGRWLDLPGWRMRVAGVELPLHAMSDTAAWVQIPSDLVRTGNLEEVTISHPDRPASITFRVQVQERVAACFGAAHQDFSRLVGPDDPAAPGEIVHIFLTGLHGVENIPDGVPNPTNRLIPIADAPALADPGAFQPFFFGLAPGLTGLQQLDLRVMGSPGPDRRLLFRDVNETNCAPIPVR